MLKWWENVFSFVVVVFKYNFCPPCFLLTSVADIIRSNHNDTRNTFLTMKNSVDVVYTVSVSNQILEQGGNCIGVIDIPHFVISTQWSDCVQCILLSWTKKNKQMEKERENRFNVVLIPKCCGYKKIILPVGHYKFIMKTQRCLRESSVTRWQHAFGLVVGSQTLQVTFSQSVISRVASSNRTTDSL